MGRFFERRICRRFEVPGAVVRYKRPWYPFREDGFPCRLLNLSKGGVALECHERLTLGKKIVVRLIVPGADPIKLRGWVRWYGYSTDEMTVAAGVEFRPFGIGLGGNSLEALDRLRELDKKYAEEEAAVVQTRKEYNPARNHLF